METTSASGRKLLENAFLYKSQIRQLKQLCAVSDRHINDLLCDAVEAFLNENFETLLTQYADEFTSRAIRDFKKQR